MEKLRNKEGFRLAEFLLCLVAVACCILLFASQTYHLPIFDDETDFEEPGWFFGEKGKPLEATELSDQHWIEPGKTYLLETTLVYSGEGDAYPCAFFTVGNYEIRVYLDGKLVFQYTKAERGFPLMKSMGGAAFSVPLGENCQGRNFLVELNTPMDYGSMRRLPGIQFGDHGTQIHHLLMGNLPSMFISMAIYFVAIVLVILGNASRQKRWAYLYFSLFALIIVIYRASQDLFLMYMWRNPILSITLEMFSLVICPLPVLLSYRSELKPYYAGTFNVLIVLSIMNVLGQLLLHFTGIFDVVQMMEANHLWILICSLALIYMGINVRKKDESIHCMRKLIPILIGAVMDFVLFYVYSHVIGPGSFFVVGNFIGLGLLISLSMLVWEARKERERAQVESQRNELLEKLAYQDGLTGIQNRAAFTKELGEIQSSGRELQNLLLVAADLNDLKITNDSLGHEAGD